MVYSSGHLLAIGHFGIVSVSHRLDSSHPFPAAGDHGVRCVGLVQSDHHPPGQSAERSQIELARTNKSRSEKRLSHLCHIHFESEKFLTFIQFSCVRQVTEGGNRRAGDPD